MKVKIPLFDHKHIALNELHEHNLKKTSSQKREETYLHSNTFFVLSIKQQNQQPLINFAPEMKLKYSTRQADLNASGGT